MSTKNPRVNVTFEESEVVMLTKLAKQNDKSVSSLVKELTLEALEMREDFYLSDLANKLDQKKAKTYCHDEVWK